MPNIEELKDLVEQARGAMLAIDTQPSRNLKSIFPAMWCEYASIVIAEILRRRGLGSWTFIDAGHREGPNGHAWLELRHDGVRQLTIDATIDQFPWGESGPFISEEQTPSAEEYSRIRYEGPWEDWHVLKGNSSYLAYATAFREESGLH